MNNVSVIAVCGCLSSPLFQVEQYHSELVRTYFLNSILFCKAKSYDLSTD
jgi:hypothetical protein